MNMEPQNIEVADRVIGLAVLWFVIQNSMFIIL